MWFNAKKINKTLKNPLSLILLCNMGSQAQKWPKIAQNGSLNRGLLNLLERYGQRGQNMYSKGGVGSVWDQVTARSWPSFQKKYGPKESIKKNILDTISMLEQNPTERCFEMQFKKNVE